MANPRNSIMSDPLPFTMPQPNGPVAKIPQSDWDKLGKSRKYKEVDAWLTAREEYWRHFLPDGSAFKDLAAKDPAEAGRWGGCASTIIDEVNTIRFLINQPVRR